MLTAACRGRKSAVNRCWQGIPCAIIVAGKAGEILKIEQYWGNLLKIPVIPLNSDWFERASPRIILAAKQLCNALSQVN